MIAKLPRIEIASYWFILLGTLSYSVFRVYKTSRHSEAFFRERSVLVHGWSILQKIYSDEKVVAKDYTDHEWYTWGTSVSTLAPLAFGFLFISRITERLFHSNHQMRGSLNAAYTVVALSYFVGINGVILCMGLLCAVYCLTYATRSKIIVWIFAFASTFLTNNDRAFELVRKFTAREFQDNLILVIYLTSMSSLRYTSFCLEMCSDLNNNNSMQKKTTKQSHFSLLDLVIYNFYWPFALTGPFLPYNEFVDQFFRPPTPWSIDRVKSIYLEFIHALFYGLLIDFLLHFLYLYALIHNSMALYGMSIWSLGGTVFLAGIFFQMKYLCSWGMARVQARCDGIDLPPGPACVIRITRYSEMWKRFDNGLYRFFKRYIYIPLGGSRRGILRQFLASALCFFFIYYWHGGENFLLLWVVINFVCVGSEPVGAVITSLSAIQNYRAEIGEQNWRRFVAVCTVPFYMASLGAIQMFFVSSSELGWIFVERLLLSNPFCLAYILVFCYAVCQLGLESDRWDEEKRAAQQTKQD